MAIFFLFVCFHQKIKNKNIKKVIVTFYLAILTFVLEFRVYVSQFFFLFLCFHHTIKNKKVKKKEKIIATFFLANLNFILEFQVYISQFFSFVDFHHRIKKKRELGLFISQFWHFFSEFYFFFSELWGKILNCEIKKETGFHTLQYITVCCR